jgi:hypothetical protein
MRLNESSVREKALQAFIKYHERQEFDNVHILSADKGKPSDQTLIGGKFEEFSPNDFVSDPTPEGWVCTLSHRHEPSVTPHGSRIYRIELKDDSTIIRESCN